MTTPTTMSVTHCQWRCACRCQITMCQMTVSNDNVNGDVSGEVEVSKRGVHEDVRHVNDGVNGNVKLSNCQKK